MATRSRYPASLFLAVFFLGVLIPGKVLALEPVVLTESVPVHELGRKMEYFAEPHDPEDRPEDRKKSRALSFELVSSRAYDHRFVPSDKDVLNFGFTEQAYWFRVALFSKLENKGRFLLEIAYPALDRLELYIPQSDKTVKKIIGGDTLPFDRRVIKHEHFVFPVDIDPGQQLRIYIRIETTGALQVPTRLWSQQAFLENEHTEKLFIGVYFGLLFVMIFYNLFLFIAVRDVSYLYYVLFVCSTLIFQTAFYGTAQEYLWPNLPWLGNRAYCISMYGTIFFGLLFAINLLNIRENHPVLNKGFFVLAAASGLSMVLSLFIPYDYMIRALPPMAIIGSLLALAVSIVSMRRGFKPARYYFAGWIVIFVGIILFASNKIGLLPMTPLTENAHLIGFAANILLLSFALADRFNIMRQDKELAQARALRVQQQAAENLEQEVERKTSALKERTQELEQAYRRLTEQDRLKSQFFANVSHELRTPLTLILTPLIRLTRSEGDTRIADVMDWLHSMLGNTQRLHRLVNQLLDFSRLESGATRPSYELLDIRAMVEPVIRGFEPFALSRQIRLSLRGPADLPRVYWDPGHLDKVLSNLISNACKFTDPEGTVTVRLDADDRELTVSVEDSGIGIAAEDLPTIFERFRQVEGEASRRYEGTGIGLALTRELVDLTGGRLEVSSEPGVGTTFALHLPLGREHIKDPTRIDGEEEQEGQKQEEREGQKEDERALAAPTVAEQAAAALAVEVGMEFAPAPAPAPDASPAPASQAEGAGADVLVVEDNPQMRRLIGEICQEHFVVRSAANGQQALELIQQQRPALVISDIMMPVMDGYELVQRIRADAETESLPVLLLTAKAGSEMLAAGLACGASDYLSKPFESEELLARAKNLVRMEQQDRQLRSFNERLQEQLVEQAAVLDRARALGRYVSPALVRSIMEQGLEVEVAQQRRSLTVFLMELKGFDTAVEALEPEEMTAMLNGYLSSMMEVALSHGATVDRLNQDLVGGFFGAPTSESPGQDAVRCARMAQKLWDRAVEICTQWEGRHVKQTPMPTLVLDSGFATVGNFGSANRLEYTAVGGAMNKARHLLAAADPGCASCTGSTWELIEGQVDGEPAGSILVPQVGPPIKIYRLTPTYPSRPSTGVSSTDQESPVGFDDQITVDMGGRDVPQPELDPERLSQGTLIGSRFEVDRRIGQGGMGVVYRVTDLKLDSVVALKLMRKKKGRDAPFRKRLYREVKLARLINHANVAQIYELGEWRGLEYIVLEHIDGQTLSHQIKTSGALAVDRGLDLFKQLCAGLSAAHVVGVVHRDFKPSNIMIENTGRAVIMDFGISRLALSARGSAETTDGVSGTPLYMAPEQFQSSARADPRTDIYALGCVAYFLFTGTPPFEKGDFETLSKMHALVTPLAPIQIKPQIPSRLSAIIMRCLKKDPAERFSRVEEIGALLEL